MNVATWVPALTYTGLDGEVTVLLDRESTSLGRSPDNDVVLSEPFVSRHHALVTREGGAFFVLDRTSTHGTWLNGRRVERAELKADDALQLGSTSAPKLRFHLQRAHEETRSDTTYRVDLLATLSGLMPLEEGTPAGKPAAREIEQLNFLLRAARQLNSGGAVEDILHALLQLTLQLTGVERGFVFLCEADHMRLAQGLRSDGTPVSEDATVSRRAMQRAIDSDQKFIMTDTLASEDAAGWQSVLVNRIRSIYCIPLRKRISATGPNELLGLLYLDSQVGTGDLGEIDHQLLDAIAAEASALLHNALLAEEEYQARQAREELAVAARIHSGLMSMTLPVLPYAVLEARTVPCLAIGGDFFDAVGLEDSVCVTVADVSGKGVSAAIVAATLQGIIHAQLMARQSLADIAGLLNQFLVTRNVGKYATMVMLRLFPDGRVEYMNCGHIQPVVVSPDGSLRRLPDNNLIVGLIAWAQYRSSEIHLQPGERILLATDGVTEAEDPEGTALGDDGWSRIARLDSLDAMLTEVSAYYAPNHATDDCTIVSLRYAATQA